MKRIKGVMIIVLLIVLSMVILLSGCADETETIEEINKKNSKAVDLGLYASSVEPFLEQYRNEDGSVSEENKRIYEIYKQSDYVIMFSNEKYEDVEFEYDYIVIVINYKNTISPNTGQEIKEQTHVDIRTLNLYNETIVNVENINWIKFALLTKEQKDQIMENETPEFHIPEKKGEYYICISCGDSVWQKVEKKSDIIIKWKL